MTAVLVLLHAVVDTQDHHACLRNNGDAGTHLDKDRWAACSWAIAKQMRPDFEQIMERSASGAVARAGGGSRHISIVRYATPPAALMWLKNLSGLYRFTVYDKRNGEDGFAAAFGPASSGEVVELPNVCDETTGYLARIVDSYDQLSDVEVFAHENDLVEEEEGRRFKGRLDWGRYSMSNISYLSMSTRYMVLGRAGKWGHASLEYVVRRLYAWAWLNSSEPYDGVWSAQCCAAFATSREQIRRRPLPFWKWLLSFAEDPLVSSYNDSKRYPPPSRRRYCLYGHVFERMWHVFMGQPPNGRSYSDLWQAEKFPQFRVTQASTKSLTQSRGPAAVMPSAADTCIDIKGVSWCNLKHHTLTRETSCPDYVAHRCAASCGNCTPGERHYEQRRAYAAAGARTHWVSLSEPFVYDEGSRHELATCTKTLHNPLWTSYRLADMLNSRFFRHSAGGIEYHKRHFPGSLVDTFVRNYFEDRWANRAYRAINATHPLCSRGGCLAHVPPVAALVHMLGVQQLGADAYTKPRSEGAAAARVACVQIRAGDVLDRSPYGVGEMLARQTSFGWRCNLPKCDKSQDVQNRSYAPPLSHWRAVRETLLARKISRVVVVAGSHYNLTDLPEPRFGKSCAYIRRIGSFFAEANLSVSYRIGRPPDDDVRFMTRVALLAPASASQFAIYTSAAAATMGVEVLPSAGLKVPDDIWSAQYWNGGRFVPFKSRIR